MPSNGLLERLPRLEAIHHEKTRRALAAGDIVALARQAGIKPDEWQTRMLQSSAPRMLLNCSRQSGKSTVTALLALHTALYESDSLVLLVSRAQRQSGELFRKIAAAYRALGRPVAAEAETLLHLVLDNGSRILSLPGRDEGTIRGYSGVRLLVVDEAARVPDELYFACRPMLAVSGGRLVALSTPFGTRGWWYDAWRSDEPWERYEIPATECPRISPDFLEEEKRNIGEFWYRQEYCCEFLDAQSQAFHREDIDAAFEEQIETWAL